MKEIKLTFKVIEKESELFGLPASDFYKVVYVMMAWVLAPMFLDIIQVSCGFWYYISCMSITFIFFRVLKKFSKKGKNLLMSYVSLKAIQPKIITPAYIKFEMVMDTDASRSKNNSAVVEKSEEVEFSPQELVPFPNFDTEGMDKKETRFEVQPDNSQPNLKR